MYFKILHTSKSRYEYTISRVWEWYLPHNYHPNIILKMQTTWHTLSFCTALTNYTKCMHWTVSMDESHHSWFIVYKETAKDRKKCIIIDEIFSFKKIYKFRIQFICAFCAFSPCYLQSYHGDFKQSKLPLYKEKWHKISFISFPLSLFHLQWLLHKNIHLNLKKGGKLFANLKLQG